MHGRSRSIWRGNTRLSTRTLAALGMAGMSALLNGRTAIAAVETWTTASGGSNSGLWSDGTNWTGTNTPPNSGDSVAFSTTTGVTAINDDLTTNMFNIAGVSFGLGSPSYTITGNPFNLTGGASSIANGSASPQAIGDNLSATAVQTITMTAGGGDVTLSGNISGTGGGITTAGAGTLTLSGTNTYTGLTTVAAGTTLLAGSTAALGASTGGLTLGGNSILNLNGFSVTKGTLTANTATSLVTSSTPATLQINYSNTGALYSGLTIGGSASLMINGSSGTSTPFGTGILITGTGSLGFQNQTNVVRDNNIVANLSTGGTLLFNGLGQFQNSSGITLPATATVTVNGTGNQWDYSVNSSTGATVNGNWLGSGRISLNQGFNAGIVLAGDLTGFGGTIDLQNTGTTSNNSTTLSFTNTTAATAGSSSAAFTQSATTAGNTGTNTIQWNGAGSRTIALGDLSTSGAPAGSGTPGTTQLRNNTANTTATFQIGNLGLLTTYAGIITNGTGSNEVTAITKVGGGAWTLTGANTYTGATAINGGTLFVNGIHTGAGAYTIGASGALGGSGSITTGSNAGITDNGDLSPGSSAGTVGTLTAALGTGIFDVSGGASGGLLFDLNTPSASDNVVLTTGTLNVGTLNFGSFTFNPLAGFGPGTYTLFTTNSPVTGSIGTATGLIDGYNGTLSIGGGSNNDVLLTVAAVPEPTSIALLALGGLLTCGLARRKRSTIEK